MSWIATLAAAMRRLSDEVLAHVAEDAEAICGAELGGGYRCTERPHAGGAHVATDVYGRAVAVKPEPGKCWRCDCDPTRCPWEARGEIDDGAEPCPECGCRWSWAPTDALRQEWARGQDTRHGYKGEGHGAGI
jgi:hypothetical protein